MKVAIAGAGAVGRSVARELIENEHDVTLIERKPEHIDVDAPGVGEQPFVAGVRPLAATRLGVPPPACGGDWRK